MKTRFYGGTCSGIFVVSFIFGHDFVANDNGVLRRCLRVPVLNVDGSCGSGRCPVFPCTNLGHSEPGLKAVVMLRDVFAVGAAERKIIRQAVLTVKKNSTPISGSHGLEWV